MTVDFNTLLVSYIKGHTPPEIINDWLLEHGDERKITSASGGYTAGRLTYAVWVAPPVVRVAFIGSVLAKEILEPSKSMDGQFNVFGDVQMGRLASDLKVISTPGAIDCILSNCRLGRDAEEIRRQCNLLIELLEME